MTGVAFLDSNTINICNRERKISGYEQKSSVIITMSFYMHISDFVLKNDMFLVLYFHRYSMPTWKRIISKSHKCIQPWSCVIFGVCLYLVFFVVFLKPITLWYSWHMFALCAHIIATCWSIFLDFMPLLDTVWYTLASWAEGDIPWLISHKPQIGIYISLIMNCIKCFLIQNSYIKVHI